MTTLSHWRLSGFADRAIWIFIIRSGGSHKDREMQTKLAKWMDDHFYTNRMFAQDVAKQLKRKRFSERTVEGWRQGRTVPRYSMFPTIAKITGGEITGNDFVSRETNGSVP